MLNIHPIVDGSKRIGERPYVVINPFSGETIATVFRPTKQDCRDAINAAQRDFNQTRVRSAHDRKTIFAKLITQLIENKEQLIKNMILESGKPYRYAAGEVERTITTMTLGMEESARPHGEILALDLYPGAVNRMGIVRRFPVGPVLGITPFNFPLNLVAHKLAPALATGNPFMLKPAAATPISGHSLIEMTLLAGALPGEMQFLPLRGSEMAEFLTNPAIAKLTFTGSAEIGWQLKGDLPKCKVSLELGGNAAVVVEDCLDLKKVAQKIITGAFAYSGQVCISVQRIFIHQKHYDSLKELLIEGTKTLQIGDPTKPETDIGPMISEEEAIRVENWVKNAIADGADLLVGGNRQGTTMEPTLLENVPEGHRLNCAEVFGPVAILKPYEDFATALRMVNDSEFGLQSGVFTDSQDKIMKAFNELNVGGVIINDVPTFRSDNMPYGGVKSSGSGREGVRYAMEEMTERKLLVLGE